MQQEEGVRVGRLRRKPSDVGVTNAPCGRRLGRLRVVVRVAARSWNSGSSQTTGLGMTMPTFGKLEKYLSEQHEQGSFSGHGFQRHAGQV